MFSVKQKREIAVSEKTLIEEDVDCCGVWPKIAKRFSWMQFSGQKDMSSMPHIDVGATKFFVNFCPSCGKPARNRNMKTKRIF